MTSTHEAREAALIARGATLTDGVWTLADGTPASHVPSPARTYAPTTAALAAATRREVRTAAVTYGVLNADMFGHATEPGEHVNWSEPDTFASVEEFAEITGELPEEMAEHAPWMIVFELDDQADDDGRYSSVATLADDAGDVAPAAPTLGRIDRQQGIAGQYALHVPVAYDGEPVESITFLGNVYGGPIVMVTRNMPQGVTVDQSVRDRIGDTLDAGWVARFFGAPVTTR